MIQLAQGESVDVAYKKLVREMIINGTFKEFEKIRFHIPEGQMERDRRRQFYKTKRKRAAARRKAKK